MPRCFAPLDADAIVVADVMMFLRAIMMAALMIQRYERC